MSVQEIPVLLIKKIIAFAFLILGGLFAVYGLVYNTFAAIAVGFLMVFVSLIVLLSKIMRRNRRGA